MPYLKTHETGKLFWAMSLVVLRLVVRTVTECCAPEFGDVAGVGASAGAGVGGVVGL